MAICMKINSLIRAIRMHREEIDFHEDQGGSASLRSKLLKHRKNYERISRSIRGKPPCMHVCIQTTTCKRMHALAGIYSAMLVSATENIPIGILTVRHFSNRPLADLTVELLSDCVCVARGDP